MAMAAKWRQAAARPARQRGRALLLGGGAPLRLGVRLSARPWRAIRATAIQHTRSGRVTVVATRTTQRAMPLTPRLR